MSDNKIFELQRQLCNALGVDPRRVRSIKIDVTAGEIPKVSVELYPSPESLLIDWTVLEVAEVNLVDVIAAAKDGAV